MIKVIKKSTKTQTHIEYEITCPHCSCVFTCEEDDFTKRERTPDGDKWVNCPECGQELSLKGCQHEVKQVITEQPYGGLRCPECGDTYIEIGPTTNDAVYRPTIVKDGQVVSLDLPHCSTTRCRCMTCGHTWEQENLW